MFVRVLRGLYKSTHFKSNYNASNNHASFVNLLWRNLSVINCSDDKVQNFKRAMTVQLITLIFRRTKSAHTPPLPLMRICQQ